MNRERPARSVLHPQMIVEGGFSPANSGEYRISSSRGRGRSTGRSSTMPWGKPDSTKTRSARKTASEIECVTIRMVLRFSFQIRNNSSLMRSRSIHPTNQRVRPGTRCPGPEPGSAQWQRAVPCHLKVRGARNSQNPAARSMRPFH